MNFAQVQKQLENLPPTFLRNSTPFTQYMDALTAGMLRGAAPIDNMMAMVSNITNARYGWLDVWGLLFNVPRFVNEQDANYLARIQYEVTAGGGTPVGICKWILAVWGVSTEVLENLPSVGYQVIFPATLTTLQIQTILNSLIRIRPAGVPITIGALSPDGLYLQTINFFGASDVTGAYLAAGSVVSTVFLNVSTNNTTPLLPDLFLTDPTLNPSLAVA